MKFREQVGFDIKFNGEIAGKRYLDFVVNEQVVVEIKKGNWFSKKI